MEEGETLAGTVAITTYLVSSTVHLISFCSYRLVRMLAVRSYAHLHFALIISLHCSMSAECIPVDSDNTREAHSEAQ